MALVEAHQRRALQPGDALLCAVERLGIDAASVDLALESVVGERRGVLAAAHDLGDPQATEPFDLVVGEGGRDGDLGQQIEPLPAVARQQPGREIAHVPVGAGRQVAAQPLGRGRDLQRGPAGGPLIEQAGGQGGGPRALRWLVLRARGADQLQADQRQAGQAGCHHRQAVGQTGAQEVGEAEGVGLAGRRRDRAVDPRTFGHQPSFRGMMDTTTRSGAAQCSAAYSMSSRGAMSR